MACWFLHVVGVFASVCVLSLCTRQTISALSAANPHFVDSFRAKLEEEQKDNEQLKKKIRRLSLVNSQQTARLTYVRVLSRSWGAASDFDLV